MVSVRQLQLALAAMVLSALLAACGGSPAAPAPTSAPEPTAKPTLTPRPTARPKPTAAPEPTAEPTAEPEPTAASESQLRDVEIEDLQTYTHDGGLFNLDIPSNWDIKDSSKPGEAIVVWTDPAENAFVTVDIFESQDQQDQDALAQLLKEYLENTFGKQQDFSQDPAKESGPSMLIVWSYTAQASNDVKAKLLGNSFIKQIGNKISLFTLVVPDDQFDRLQPSLDKILGTYSVDESVALNPEAPAADGPVVIDQLTNYTYKTGLFSIDVPNGWRETDNSKPGEAILLWSEPRGHATVVVDIFQQTEEQTSDQLTEFLRTFLTNTFSKEQGFTVDDPKPQDDGSILLVWSYDDQKLNLTALGNSFIEQRGDKISILSVIVPDEQFDQLLPKTNEILQSYSIEASADLP